MKVGKGGGGEGAGVVFKIIVLPTISFIAIIFYKQIPFSIQIEGLPKIKGVFR